MSGNTYIGMLQCIFNWIILKRTTGYWFLTFRANSYFVLIVLIANIYLIFIFNFTISIFIAIFILYNFNELGTLSKLLSN